MSLKILAMNGCDRSNEQECIAVGCVPTVAVAILRGGGGGGSSRGAVNTGSASRGGGEYGVGGIHGECIHAVSGGCIPPPCEQNDTRL